jgi:antitoxin component YwqK of YwqJK toxin-antitoxin module
MNKSLPFLSYTFICLASFLSSGCQRSSQEVVKTSYYHQYGPEIKPDEWKDQGATGELVEWMGDGVEVRKCYANDVLNGMSTWSFPRSKVVERFEEYDNGKKIAFGCNYSSGSPEWQDELLADDKHVLRSWYEDGSPRFVEELFDSQVVEGQYFTDSGDVEAIIIEGNGMKIKRDPQGVLVERERYVDREPVVREMFYPNGLVKEVISFRSNKKDGLRKCFDDAGRPIIIESWKNDSLNGMTTFFQEGIKVRQINYKNGKKDGLEMIFRPDSGIIVEEISWSEDVKHGSNKVHTGSDVITIWYLKGVKVSQEQFMALPTNN